MRKLLIILFLLIFLLIPAIPVHSATTVSGRPCPGGAGSATYCTGAATCTATNPGECDLLCEDFEGASDCGDDAANDQNCRNTGFVVTLGTDDTIDFTTAHSGTLGCTDKGSNAVQVAITAGSHATYAYKDLGATKAVTYTQFYVNVVSEGIGDSMVTALVKGDQATNGGTSLWYLNLYQTGGSLYLRLTYYNAAPFATITSSSPISAGTWYRINIYTNTTTGDVSFSIDGSSQGTATDLGNRPWRYLHIGDVASDAATTFQVDNIAVDDDTIQGDCHE